MIRTISCVSVIDLVIYKFSFFILNESARLKEEVGNE
jgi:hypothetical protein